LTYQQHIKKISLRS